MIIKKFAFGTGRKKCSFAQVIIFPGNGLFQINYKLFEIYFQENWKQISKNFFLLNIFNLDFKYNILAFVKGGGLTSQITAINLAIARSLSVLFPKIRFILKKFKFLKYDSRVIERKKYGLKKARKSSQYSKR